MPQEPSTLLRSLSKSGNWSRTRLAPKNLPCGWDFYRLVVSCILACLSVGLPHQDCKSLFWMAPLILEGEFEDLPLPQARPWYLLCHWELMPVSRIQFRHSASTGQFGHHQSIGWSRLVSIFDFFYLYGDGRLIVSLTSLVWSPLKLSNCSSVWGEHL